MPASSRGLGASATVAARDTVVAACLAVVLAACFAVMLAACATVGHAPLGPSEAPLAEVSSSGVTLSVTSLADSEGGLFVDLTLANGASAPVCFFWRHGWAQEGDRQVRPLPSPLGDPPADVVEAGSSTRGQIILPGLHGDGPIHLEFRVQAAAAVAPFGNLVLSVTLPGGSN